MAQTDDFGHLLDDKGQIRPEAIDDLLIEVISGKSLFTSEGELYATRGPTMDERDKARIIYTRKLHEVKKLGLPARAEVEANALRMGAINQADRDEVRAQEEMLKRQQAARDTTTDPLQKVHLANEMEVLHRRIIESKVREEEIFCHCAESKGEDARTGFLVACCTIGGELLDVPVWSSWSDYQDSDRWILLLDARRSYMRVSHGLPIRIIRAVSRCHDWKSRWKAARESGAPLFEGSSADWDANKRNLAWWTEFYEAIGRHPEVPPDHVIQDDDALQEWVNHQVAKRKNPKGTQQQQPKAPPTYIDGRGQRHQMVKIGEEQVQVNTPFKVRV